MTNLKDHHPKAHTLLGSFPGKNAFDINSFFNNNYSNEKVISLTANNMALVLLCRSDELI